MQILGGIDGHGLCGSHFGPGLGDFLHAVAAFKLGKLGFLGLKRGSGTVFLLGQNIGIQPGHGLPFLNLVAFVHQNFRYAAANPKTKVNLPDVHIAVKGEGA